MNGLLLLDKPAGPTSHDIVARLRKEMRVGKVGHTGTLDPFATGLLPLLLGQATRLSQFFLGLDKEYWVRARLGQETDTLDVTGQLLRSQPVAVSPAEIGVVADSLTGEMEQIPPMFSAKKIGGKRLYTMARAGLTLERRSCRVTIFRLEIVKLELPEIELNVCCSSGTYIRSLVHDFGQRLGCGALVAGLRRLAVGPYRVEDAVPLAAGEGSQPPDRPVIPLERLLSDFPLRMLGQQEERSVRHGQPLGRREEPAGWIRLFAPDNRLIALGMVEELKIQPRIVLLEGSAG